MTRPLILSIFPGIDLLGRAFEEEWPEACVVRGPDLLWGGDIKAFHPPAGKFDGVIGGPPCYLWANTRTFSSSREMVNLIPEFERVVSEAQPMWFLMENVVGAPLPNVPGYLVKDEKIRDVWVGGETNRLRRFSFGTCDGLALSVEIVALYRTDPLPAVISGGSARRKDGTRYKNGRNYGAKTTWAFEQGKVAQGLDKNFDLPPFTVKAKVAAIGNGVPLPMGRAVAKAVKRSFGG